MSVPVRFYPTEITLPLWFRKRAVLPRINMFRLRISDISVRRITTRFEPPRGLVRPLLDTRFRPSLRAEAYLNTIRAEAPADGVEIVEWMHYAHADRLTLSARCQEYNRLGSQLVSDSGDPYIPGVSVEDCKYEKMRGREVRARGFAIANTPRGNFNVASLGKGVGVFRDLLTAGTISYVGSIQFVGNLLKWRSLASTPIRQTVGFFMDSRGNVAPNFFEQLPIRPKLTVTVRQRISSSDAQTLSLTFRDPTDYTRVLGTREVDVAEGTNELTWTMSAFPFVPPVVNQTQPEDDVETSVEEYVVI